MSLFISKILNFTRILRLSFRLSAVVFVLGGLFGGSGLSVAEAMELHTKASLISEKEVLALGEPFDVGLRLQMDKGWHTYWKEPGATGKPTTIQWKLPEGFRADPIQWPKPKVITSDGQISYGYENEVLLLVRIHPPKAGYKEGDIVSLEADVEWLECEEVCILGSAKVSLSLPVGNVSQNSKADVLALFEKYRSQIPQDEKKPEAIGSEGRNKNSTIETQRPQSWGNVLVAAFLGGFILNFMPCVLPVLAIKIFSFIKQGQQDRSRIRQLGFFYGLGVLSSFWVLALIVIGLKAAGQHVGWGFQFQDPRFIIVMAFIVTSVALNFFGFFELDLSPAIASKAHSVSSLQGNAGAFLNGTLATILATPCTAPLLSVALSFAFSQTALIIFVILSVVGLGFAFPYVVLAWHPKFLQWMPKPGPWMQYFKQSMGFAMLGTVVWLVSILTSSKETRLAIGLLAWLLATSFIVWLLSKLKPGRWIWTGLFLMVMTILSVAHLQSLPKVSENEAMSLEEDEWRPYSKEAFQKALESPNPIFIDFTAAWCATCQVNKRTTLSKREVLERFKAHQVILFRADKTKPNPEVDEALRALNQYAIPVNVYYPSDRSKPPVLLPTLLTPQIIFDLLDQQSSSQRKD